MSRPGFRFTLVWSGGEWGTLHVPALSRREALRGAREYADDSGALAWHEEGYPAIPLCPACVAGIGGAHAGPDAEWRECAPGESCGAADCAGRGES